MIKKILIDSYSFLGKYESEYADALDDALESVIEYYNEEYPDHKFTDSDFNCDYDGYIEELKVQFVNEIGKKEHIKISKDDLFPSFINEISFKLPSYNVERINARIIMDDTLYKYFHKLCKQRNLYSVLDDMNCYDEYEYWTCGSEVCGALFDTYFIDEIEDFNSDIEQTHNKPFELAMQYITLKPRIKKKLKL